MPAEQQQERHQPDRFSSSRFLLNGSSKFASDFSGELNAKQASSPPPPVIPPPLRPDSNTNNANNRRWTNFLGRIGGLYSSLVSSGSSRKRRSIFLSPSATFRRLAAAREVVSLQTPSDFVNDEQNQEQQSSSSGSLPLRQGVNLPVVGEIRWKTMKKFAIDWLRDPKNLALLAWILAVAVSGAILFMVMTGMLNAAIPSKSARNAWFEVNNQILNALFTLMCLYLHPRRFLHLYQLIRWSPRDVLALRLAYCKHGTRKPHEWSHMLVVVVLLHLNCFSQYALCGLNWGYKRSERPAIGVAICLASAIGFAAAAGVYNTLSPLGRDYVLEEDDGVAAAVAAQDEEAAARLDLESGTRSRKRWTLLERHRSFVARDGKQVENPTWQGGLFDCCSDPEVAVLTTACSVCVFGWNMDRLGFGNRFVHIATFLLICSAPYWIFLLAAGNIDNRKVRQGLGISGIVLCVFGLMYGGFWRIRMRKTYGLPAQRWCCGQPNATDCTQWMFCSLCSLCQEVRTASFYHIKDAKFYVKRQNGAGLSPESSSPLQPPGVEMMEEAVPASKPLETDSDPVPVPREASLGEPGVVSVPEEGKTPVKVEHITASTQDG